jgi:hypothetical protein
MPTQIGTGFSPSADAGEVGRQIAEEALRPLAGRPQLLVLFSTPHLDSGELLKAVHGVVGVGVPLVGGCAPGVIVRQGAFRHGAALLALRSDEMTISTALGRRVYGDPEAAGRRLARDLALAAGSEGDYGAGLMLVIPATSQRPLGLMRLVESIGDEAGPLCNLVGGGVQSSDGHSPPVYYGDEVRDDAVAAVLLRAPSGVGLSHGYQPLGRPLVVTRARDNTIYELDGRTAYEAYAEQFPNRDDLTLEGFDRFALDYPLGLPQVGGDYIVRDPYTATPEGALVCAGAIPERAVVRIMVGDGDTLLRAAGEAADESLRYLNGRRPTLAFVCGCVSRLDYLGPRADEEVAIIRQHLGADTPLIGHFSYGEMAARHDVAAAVHNKTAVIGVMSGG